MSDSDNSDSESCDVKTSSKKVKYGAFKSMGLSPAILKGIIRRGYRLPTPIQRKSIPHIMAGRDFVGMSRTGSGKTAAFLIPMFEKLKQHLPGSGPRAMIMSPSRDLALQTARFVKELGKFTDLRTAVIIGGDRMEDQFTLLHSEPDILIVTPGRLLHIMVEMQLKLSSINFLVFDEADRLFELGLASQVSEVLSRTSVDRQTVLFSATLPSVVAEFVAAGLHNPKLIRLDVDAKLSPQLSLRHLFVSSADKLAILVHLLRNLNSILGIDEKGRHASCVVFVATKYHVEYVHSMLSLCDIPAVFAFSSMDPTARKINMAKFRMNQANVLVVTDVAARGIDIPELDAVINYNFPAKPKLFVHRVGRVARAGRCGMAFSLLSSDEVPYLIDLNMFLGKSLAISSQITEASSQSDTVELGTCPRLLIDRSVDLLSTVTNSNDPEAEKLVKAMQNAMAKFLRLRPSASPEAIKQAKKIVGSGVLPTHSMFANEHSIAGDMMIDRIRDYKPKEAFIALSSNSSKAICNQIAKIRESRAGLTSASKSIVDSVDVNMEDRKNDGSRKESTEIVESEPSTFARKPKVTKEKKNMEYFVPYVPNNQRSESELKLSNNTANSLAAATMDIADDERLNRRHVLENGSDKRLVRVWHRKARKFINIDLAAKSDGTVVRVKSETTGKWIPKTFKSKKYETWKRRNVGAVEADESTHNNRGGLLEVKKKPDWRNKKARKKPFKPATSKRNSHVPQKGRAAKKGSRP